ncbi:MAG: HAD family hydrolase [Myxococcota bacterium]|nr:MAG: HAD family hydrolase [Proteobacteria bacterium TMED72]
MASVIRDMTDQLKAVFFDLGGTLFSYRAIAKSVSGVMEEAATRLGLDTGAAAVGPAFMRASRRAGKEFLAHDYYLHRDLFVESYRLWVDEIEGQADDEFYDWFYEAQRDALVTGVTARPDCIETLRALRERGLSLSIVSNIDDDYLGPIVKTLELAPLLDHVSSSEEALSCKPHSQIYHHAMKKADVAPHEVLFVGDSPPHDVRGARAVGMLSALIEETPGVNSGPDTDEPDYRIESLSDLLPLVDEIMQKPTEDRS